MFSNFVISLRDRALPLEAAASSLFFSAGSVVLTFSDKVSDWPSKGCAGFLWISRAAIADRQIVTRLALTWCQF